jgi:UDP-N-acetylglucosamine enolpyruvyl transferase
MVFLSQISPDKSCKMGNHIKKSGCCNDKQISSTLSTQQSAKSKWVQVNKEVLPAPATQLQIPFFLIMLLQTTS